MHDEMLNMVRSWSRCGDGDSLLSAWSQTRPAARLTRDGATLLWEGGRRHLPLTSRYTIEFDALRVHCAYNHHIENSDSLETLRATSKSLRR